MAEYIDREATINAICNEKCKSEYGKCQKGLHDGKLILCVCDFIRFQPAADVAPVVRGQLHYQGRIDPTYDCGTCNVCGGYNDMKAKFCNWCGANLKGESK